jgi:hypothetical protein
VNRRLPGSGPTTEVEGPKCQVESRAQGLVSQVLSRRAGGGGGFLYFCTGEIFANKTRHFDKKLGGRQSMARDGMAWCAATCDDRFEGTPVEFCKSESSHFKDYEKNSGVVTAATIRFPHQRRKVRHGRCANWWTRHRAHEHEETKGTEARMAQQGPCVADGMTRRVDGSCLLAIQCHQRPSSELLARQKRKNALGVKRQKSAGPVAAAKT